TCLVRSAVPLSPSRVSACAACSWWTPPRDCPTAWSPSSPVRRSWTWTASSSWARTPSPDSTEKGNGRHDGCRRVPGVAGPSPFCLRAGAGREVRRCRLCPGLPDLGGGVGFLLRGGGGRQGGDLRDGHPC